MSLPSQSDQIIQAQVSVFDRRQVLLGDCLVPGYLITCKCTQNGIESGYTHGHPTITKRCVRNSGTCEPHFKVFVIAQDPDTRLDGRICGSNHLATILIVLPQSQCAYK